MASWSAAIKAEFPRAKVALVTMSWRSSLSPHLASWNGGVFNASADPPRLAAVQAATIHPYFAMRSVAPAPTPLARNGGSTTTVAPPSDMELALALATPVEALVENARMLAKDVPGGMELWATEVA
eukprot:gene15678-26947_t